jgi:hypothetical protein
MRMLSTTKTHSRRTEREPGPKESYVNSNGVSLEDLKRIQKLSRKTRRNSGKKHAKIKRGAKYNNEPQSRLQPPEPPSEFNFDRYIGQAKNHLINKK